MIYILLNGRKQIFLLNLTIWKDNLFEPREYIIAVIYWNKTAIIIIRNIQIKLRFRGQTGIINFFKPITCQIYNIYILSRNILLERFYIPFDLLILIFCPMDLVFNDNPKFISIRIKSFYRSINIFFPEFYFWRLDEIGDFRTIT